MGRRKFRGGIGGGGCTESQVTGRGAPGEQGGIKKGPFPKTGKTCLNKGPAEGRSVGVEPENPVREKPGKGLPKTVFQGMGEGDKEAPFGGIFQGTEYPRRGMTQDCGSAVLPKINQAASSLGVKPESPGPEYRRNQT
jgi:hypothetical protein